MTFKRTRTTDAIGALGVSCMLAVAELVAMAIAYYFEWQYRGFFWIIIPLRFIYTFLTRFRKFRKQTLAGAK